MTTTDKRGKLNDDPFDYQITNDGRVLLYWHNKHVKTLAGKSAAKFLVRIVDLPEREAQLLMARATGNFKRGNERAGKGS